MSDPDKLSKTEMQLIITMRNNPKYAEAVSRIVQAHREMTQGKEA